MPLQVTPPASSLTGSPLLRPPPIISSSSSSSSSSPCHPTRRQLLLSAGLLFLAGNANVQAAGVAAYDPVSEAERTASTNLSRRVRDAVELLDRGRELQARGEFRDALRCFTQVISEYKDLALSEYARVGRALVLYEIGDRDESITEMEDVSISLKGYPEIHAALAAALYADKHAPLLAENQFAIATLLDPHYTDISYVRDAKHWPPSLVTSLQHFITLS